MNPQTETKLQSLFNEILNNIGPLLKKFPHVEYKGTSVIVGNGEVKYEISVKKIK